MMHPDITEMGLDDTSKLFGDDPPRGIYFVMEFEHNLNHPLNVNVNPAGAGFESNPIRTLSEAQAIAHDCARDYAKQRTLTLIEAPIEEDEDGVDLPAFYGVDPTRENSDENVVFTTMVRLVDYRDETIH